MSFSSVDNKKQYATDGIVDTFAFPYPFQQTSDLVVQLKDNTTLLVTTLVENTDYTVTTVGDTGRFTSGSVVTDSVFASGSTITITRIVANDQETANYNAGGEFDEQSTEDAFDKASMQAQQGFNDAIILKRTGDVAGPLELPDLADNAGKLLQINDAGDGLTASDSTTSSDARVNSLFNGAAADDIFATFINLVNGGLVIDGTGTPEGAVVAPVGSIFLRTDGGAGTSIYFKETGAGNAGWVDSASVEAARANSIIDQGGGNNIQVKVVEIGAWDMNATTDVTITTGVPRIKFRGASVFIRADSGTSTFDLCQGVDENNTAPQGFHDPADNQLILYRLTGGTFDGAGTDKVEETIDNAAAVNKGGGLVGIPITGHTFVVDDSTTIAGTTNYDGTYTIISVTANEIVVTATYVAETFAGTETASWSRGWATVWYIE